MGVGRNREEEGRSTKEGRKDESKEEWGGRLRLLNESGSEILETLKKRCLGQGYNRCTSTILQFYHMTASRPFILSHNPSFHNISQNFDP